MNIFFDPDSKLLRKNKTLCRFFLLATKKVFFFFYKLFLISLMVS
jgi:hypothetical protein